MLYYTKKNYESELMRVFCLWLNGKKISNPSDIRNNYDSEALRGYYLGGSLSKWLEMAGDSEKARLVEKVKPNGNIDRQLAVIFGLVREDKPVRKTEKKPKLPEGNGSFNSHLLPASFSFGSFTGSFVSGSFALGSFNSLLLSTSFSFGSFRVGSFTLGSFRLNNNNNNNGGSFSVFGGSYAVFAGSFSIGAGSFNSGSFNGSFGAVAQPKNPKAQTAFVKSEKKPLTPEQKITINLSSEPLNRFGYGIHLV